MKCCQFAGRWSGLLGLIVGIAAWGGMANWPAKATRSPLQDEQVAANAEDEMETITFGAGCFWCTEAVFLQIRGVERVVSGFSGG
ncbi:MAG TPA: peptide-methionine (S)-S-oxide reductase, partial [Pirellulaceae bacterium]|nr:peptide-methionine (S)-S-oxide reductase [Pirellulaceae bacterium]